MGILQVKNLTKEFDGIRALDGLSFDIEAGSITALIGPNGAGKTTAFNLITGFLKPEAGEVIFNGREITESPPHKIARMGLSRTFQAIRLFSQMSVLDNVMLGLRYAKGENLLAALLRRKAMLREDQKNHEKALALLERVGLSAKLGEMAEKLSHGQRKLLELARALATDATLLLLDEPTAGLSPQATAEMLCIIEALRQADKTVLFIEHNMHVVMGIAQHVIVLNYGKKIAEGTPQTIQRDPAVIEAYLGKKRVRAA